MSKVRHTAVQIPGKSFQTIEIGEFFENTMIVQKHTSRLKVENLQA